METGGQYTNIYVKCAAKLPNFVSGKKNMFLGTEHTSAQTYAHIKANVRHACLDGCAILAVRKTL